MAGSRIAKGKHPIKVGNMEGQESDQLLRVTLEDVGSFPSELAKLASRLEHLPLALVQAAAFIYENNTSVGEYLELLDKSDQHIVDLLSEEFETVGRDLETPRAVAETWILSFQQIERENSLAGELLSLMSLLDRQAIPQEFLRHYSNNTYIGGAVGDVQLTKAVGILKAFSLVTGEKGGSLDIHRLVQLVTRKWLSRVERIERFSRAALFTVSQLYPFGRYETRTTCRAYLPHGYAVLKLQGAESGEEVLAKASLLSCIGGYLYFEGTWNDAQRLQEDCVGIRKRLLGVDHPDTLSSIANLASTYREQGRWEEAEKLFMQVMEASKAKLGADHPSTLISMANLASTYRERGRWEEAEKLEAQVMETSKAKLGADHPHTLNSMGNLASTYGNQGRWEEAEELEMQVMETRKAKLGADHPHTLISMGNLASTYGYQGRVEEAEKLFVQVMETSRTRLGADHPDTLISMNNLAHTWKSMGKSSEATDLIRACIRLLQLRLGLNHPYTQSSVSTLNQWQSGRDIL